MATGSRQENASKRNALAENLPEALSQLEIDVLHRHRMAEIDEARDAEFCVLDAAGHDAGEMLQLRLDIDRNAVQRHPALQPHADRRDLVFMAVALVRTAHPDADPPVAPLAADVEGCQRL